MVKNSIPDKKLLSNRDEALFTQRANEILNFLKLKDEHQYIDSLLTVQGSFNYSIYQYFSDIDSMNNIHINDDENEAVEILKNHLQGIAKHLKKHDRSFSFSDLKCGVDDEGNSLHWNVDEVITGKKNKYTLMKAITQPSYCKIDVIIPYYGRYIEVSMIYTLTCKSGTIGKKKLTLADFKKEIRSGASELIKEHNYFKAIKRIFSLARLNRDVKTIRKIQNLIISNLSKLSTIKSDLSTLELMMDKKITMSTMYLNIQLNRTKDMISSILDISGVNFANFGNELTKIYNLIKDKKYTKARKQIKELSDIITSILNKEVLKYLKDNNLSFNELIK